IRNNGFLLNDHNAITNGMSLIITILKVFPSGDTNVIADSGAFVDNRVVYITTLTHTHKGFAQTLTILNFCQTLVTIGSHHVSITDHGTPPYPGTNTNHRPFNLVSIDNTAACNNY